MAMLLRQRRCTAVLGAEQAGVLVDRLAVGGEARLRTPPRAQVGPPAALDEQQVFGVAGQHPAHPGQGVLVEVVGVLVTAQGAEHVALVAAGGQHVGVVFAELLGPAFLEVLAQGQRRTVVARLFQVAHHADGEVADLVIAAPGDSGRCHVAEQARRGGPACRGRPPRRARCGQREGAPPWR